MSLPPVGSGAVPCDAHRALVVDDDRAVAQVFRYSIEHDLPDLHVDSVENGQAAVDAFREAHYAILIMDLAMPVMDGRKAFQEIARLCESRGWEMPSVLFCTGYAPPDKLANILDGHPQHGLFLKPVRLDEIVHAIEDRVGHSKSE